MVNKILSLLSGKYFVLQSEMSSDDGDKMVITVYKEHKKAIKCNNVASKRFMLEKDVHLGGESYFCLSLL